MENNQLKTLRLSITHYRELLRKTEEVEKTLADFKVEPVQKLSEELGSILERIKQTDTLLESLHKVETLPEEQQKLYQERQHLVELIFNKNKDLEPRMQGMKAIQAKEMQQLNLGRKTASGYAQQVTANTGRIINRSR